MSAGSDYGSIMPKRGRPGTMPRGLRGQRRLDTHAHLRSAHAPARRWLFPDTSTYLDAAPWRPDYQLRLIRTDARLIRFSDEFHRPIAAAGPGRFVQQPIWHVDPLLRTFEQRLEKARRYERTRP